MFDHGTDARANGKGRINTREYRLQVTIRIIYERIVSDYRSLALSPLISSWTASQAGDKPAFESLSAKDRIEVFETVWKTINEEYYDPAFNGVNWSEVRERYRPRVETAKSDDEFYLIIKQMLLELQDLHTGFAAPGEQSRSSGISVSRLRIKSLS